MLLMVILIWMQVGFSMVLLSSAIKAVPGETLEAARIDGASELQIFFKVIVPQIRGTLITVFITVLIMVLKVFDIVFVMTNGAFKTSVIALDFYNAMFRARDAGIAAAIVVILLIAVLPILIYQVRHFREEETSAMTAMDTKESQKSWFSRIMMVLLCLLWTIPTLGLLVTSVRDRDDIDTSGWWTAFGKGGWTLDNYDDVLTGNDMASTYVNSIIIAVPGDGDPDHDRSVCGVRVHVHAVLRSRHAVRDRRCVAGGAAAGGAGADAEAVRAGRSRHQRAVPVGVAAAHRLRHAAGDLRAAQLHGDAAQGGRRVSTDRWRNATSRRSGS